MPVTSCPSPPPQPVFGIVTFDYTELCSTYPEFAGISSALALQAFNTATLILNNSCYSRVRDANQRLQLLYLLTAHVLFLNAGSNDAGVITPLFSGLVSLSGTTASVASVSSGFISIGVSLYDGPGVGMGLVLPGTAIISAFGTGTGGVGTYTLASSVGVVAPETMIVQGVPVVNPPPGIVGRISQAAEGAVSVSAELAVAQSSSQAFFVQTKYGYQFWQATARYRTMLYVGAPAFGPNGYGGNGPFGPGGGCGCG